MSLTEVKIKYEKFFIQLFNIFLCILIHVFFIFLLQKNKKQHFENELLKEVSCL